MLPHLNPSVGPRCSFISYTIDRLSCNDKGKMHSERKAKDVHSLFMKEKTPSSQKISELPCFHRDLTSGKKGMGNLRGEI